MCVCAGTMRAGLTAGRDSDGGQRELGFEELCLQDGLLQFKQLLLLELLSLSQFHLLLLYEADLAGLTPKTGLVGMVRVLGGGHAHHRGHGAGGGVQQERLHVRDGQGGRVREEVQLVQAVHVEQIGGFY